MNPVERVIRRVDAAQQRNRVSAFIFGVIKKYGDDNGGTLVANLTHSAFVTVFPLLLILVTVLVQVAAFPSVHHEILKAVTDQFPLVGDKLAGNIKALNRSSVASLAIGLAVLTYGATGLAQAGLFTMEQVWNLPGPARPGYVPRMGRAALFLLVLGTGVIASTLLAGLVTYGQQVGVTVLSAQVFAAGANVGLYLACFRVLTPKGVPTRNLVAGAVAGGIAWTVLQSLAAVVVHHYLKTDSVYGLFATVLVLLAWINIGAQIAVYAAEINVVLTRRLWPRSIVQPPLTEADRASLALQALQNQRREDQHVEVSFSDEEAAAVGSLRVPRTPDEVAPPGSLKLLQPELIQPEQGQSGPGQAEPSPAEPVPSKPVGAEPEGTRQQRNAAS